MEGSLDSMTLIQKTISKLKDTHSLQKRAILNRTIDHMIKEHPVCFAKTLGSQANGKKFINAALYANIISKENILHDLKTCHINTLCSLNVSKFIDL